MRLTAARIVGILALLTLVNCDGCGDDDATACTVEQLDGGVNFICGKDEATIPNPPPAEPCSVSQTENTVTLTCPDGSSVTLPIGGSSGGDAGTQSCMVTTNADGSVTIKCPDGSSATIPAPIAPSDGGVDAGSDSGSDATVPPLAAIVQYTGATSTACGGCHDSQETKIHFSTMTTIVDGLPIEGCPTCHKESAPNAVSVAHARPEFGPPGFKVEILAVSIDPGTRKAAVNLKVQDGSGRPLDLTGVSTNFTITHVPLVQKAGNTSELIPGPYVNYLTRTATQVDNPDYPLQGTPRVVQQGTTDSSGSYANTGAGLYTYTFAAALPADYDVSQTHIVGLYSTRTVGPVRWVSNATYAWVPNNAAATPGTRKIVKTETCNSCHNPLSFHGGSRQEVQVCLTCHSQGSTDPESNNSIDFNVMVHRIHRGAQLPSVKAGGKYGIVGRNNETADYSHIEYPQDIVNCQSCHTDTDEDRWVSNGATPVCMSCHENIFEPGVHGFAFDPGANPTNVVCGNSQCHSPGGNVRDAREAHLTFLNTDAPIFDISIVSVTVANADAAPALRVKAMRGTRLSGATQPVTSVDNISTLNVFFNGPNTDFLSNGHDIKQYNKASLVGLVATSTPGEFTFSLPETLREAAGKAGDVTKSSYTLSIRAAYDPTPGAAPDNDRLDMIKNPTAAISAAGAPVARKSVVDNAKCNNCHGNLQEHGGDILARNVEECIMCHTSTLETSPRQGANKDPGPTTSLRFSQLVHRVHGSAIATQSYVLYGYASAAPFPKVDFSAVPFPGDVKDCLTCHIDGTQFVPVSGSPAPTQTLVLDANGQPIKK
jgi:OmcA/MtrC family decaheme c-type cytochrome